MQNKMRIIRSPQALNIKSVTSVFLAGTIDNGNSIIGVGSAEHNVLHVEFLNLLFLEGLVFVNLVVFSIHFCVTVLNLGFLFKSNNLIIGKL